MTETPPPLSALRAVCTTFCVSGLAVGTFGGSLPVLRARLGTDERGLALLLIVMGLCAIVSMQIGGRVSDRRGAAAPTAIGAALMAAGLVIVGLAVTMPVAVLGAVVFGAGNGSLDVSMNASAVHLERLRRRSTMSVAHAFFSVGNLAGALLVVAVGRFADGPGARMVTAVAIATAVIVPAYVASHRRSLHTEPVAAADGGGRSRISAAAYLLAAMALCFGMTEGTAVDWSSLHTTEVAGVDGSVGALGLASVAGLMVVIRLLGDGIVERFGRGLVVRAGAFTALVGYVGTITTGALVPVLIAWALVGLGVGLVAPQIYGLAGHMGGGRVLALVTGTGYVAFLAGPAVIGAAAHEAGLQRAMVVPLVTALALALMSFRMPRIAGEPGSGPL